MTNHSPDALLHKDRICDYLKLNSTQNRPIKSRQMQRLWNIPDLAVRQAVGLLRDEGKPIASGPRGFYYAKSPEQLESTIDNLRERILVMERRRSKLISAQNKMRHDTNGQGLLFTDLDE